MSALGPARSDRTDRSAGTVPLISVVICTHNRARSLAAALESIVGQLPPDGGTEVIVVDNRSNDQTAQVAGTYTERGVRYVQEPRLGLCHARNSGWRNARGRYVAYLDDDAIALPGWLDAIRAAFEREPRAGVVGGRVDPTWESARPRWLSDDVSLTLTIVNWPDGPKHIPDIRVEWLVGANMAFRREVLERAGGFNPALDRVGSNMLSSGDVFLTKQVMKLGYLAYYDPAMAVTHAVPASRMRKEWFYRRYYWQGVSDAVMVLIEERPPVARRLLKAAARALRLLGSPHKVIWLVLPTSDPRRFTRKCFALIEVGHIVRLLGGARR